MAKFSIRILFLFIYCEKVNTNYIRFVVVIYLEFIAALYVEFPQLIMFAT